MQVGCVAQRRDEPQAHFLAPSASHCAIGLGVGLAAGPAPASGWRPRRRCRRRGSCRPGSSSHRPGCRTSSRCRAKPGPTSLVSTAWQAMQPFLFSSGQCRRRIRAWQRGVAAGAGRRAGWPCGVGTVLRADDAVLLGQVAVRIARVSPAGTRRAVGFDRAVLHARRALHVGLARLAARPHRVVGGHAVAVGQQRLRLGHGGVAEHEVVGHDAAEVEQEGGDGIDLVGRQRLRASSRAWRG